MVFHGTVLGATARPFPRLKSAVTIKETCNNNNKKTQRVMLSTPLPVAKKRKEKLNSRQIGDATSSEALNYRVAKYSSKLNHENTDTGFCRYELERTGVEELNICTDSNENM